jgi:hypothetical protein
VPIRASLGDLKGPSEVLMGVLRDGPGKAKEGTVSPLEKRRKEKKESEDHLKNSKPLWGPCRLHGGLRGPY